MLKILSEKSKNQLMGAPYSITIRGLWLAKFKDYRGQTCAIHCLKIRELSIFPEFSSAHCSVEHQFGFWRNSQRSADTNDFFEFI